MSDDEDRTRATRPPIRIGSAERIVGRSAGEREMGPYVELDVEALRYLDGLLANDVSGAREHIAEMIAALEAEVGPHGSS